MRTRVLITGITGYIGSNIAYVLGKNFDVVGLGRGGRFPLLSDAIARPLTLIEGDITNKNTCIKAARGVSLIIHAAGSIRNVAYENPAERDVVVGGAQALREVAENEGARLLYLSSIAVYGTEGEHPRPFREDDVLHPDTAYARAKKDGEDVIRLYENAYVLRLAHVYGEGRALPPHAHTVASTFASAASHGMPLHISADEDARIDLIHIDDVVRVISAISDLGRSFPNVCNVGSGLPLTLRSFAELTVRIAEKRFGASSAIVVDPPTRSRSRFSRSLDIMRARSLFPWFPSIALEDGMARMLGYARTHSL